MVIAGATAKSNKLKNTSLSVQYCASATRQLIITQLQDSSMKNLTYALLIGGSLLVSACYEDDATRAEEIYTVDEIIAKVTTTASLTYEANVPIARDTTGEWEKFGPFTVTPTFSKELSNHHVILTPTEGYENGVYICDVYSASAEVMLPAEVVFAQVDASREGYGWYGGGAKNIGPTTFSTFTGETGNGTHTILIWSIVPKYDQLGHSLDNSPLPGDLTGGTFTYSYWLNI